MDYTFTQSPTYGRLREEFGHHQRLDKFTYFLLESLDTANACAVGKGGKIPFTPELTRVFGLDEAKIRYLADSLKKFHEKQGNADTVLLAECGDHLILATTYKKVISFSDWLLNHEPKGKKNFGELLSSFDDFFMRYEGGAWSGTTYVDNPNVDFFVRANQIYWDLDVSEGRNRLHRHFADGEKDNHFESIEELRNALGVYELPTPRVVSAIAVPAGQIL